MVADPSGWWGGDPHSHMLPAILPAHHHSPDPWSCQLLAEGRTRLTAPAQGYAPNNSFPSPGTYRLYPPRGPYSEEREPAGAVRGCPVVEVGREGEAIPLSKGQGVGRHHE